jgi:hypothetical protein
MYFPSICADNFFNNPDDVREFALSLEYEDCSISGGIWPGKRTKELSLINPDYHKDFTHKILSLFFDRKRFNTLHYRLQTYFQLTESNQYGKNNTGWVHDDGFAPLAGVVYLSKQIDPQCGTSICSKASLYSAERNVDVKREMFQKYNSSNDQLYKDSLDINNSQFVETVRFNNIYNRLIAYDGSQFHVVNNLYGENEPRLTQVFFFDYISADWFPIPHSRTVKI